jgi:hypothetical protein
MFSGTGVAAITLDLNVGPISMSTSLPATAAILAMSLCVLVRPPTGFAADADKSELELDTILTWLPEDTETLIVGNGPGKFGELSEERRKLPLAESLVRLIYYPFAVSPEAAKHLVGRKIKLAVEGARKFRHPKSLGAWHYEGCHILALESDLDESWSDALAAGANRTERVSGHDVYVFEKKLGIPEEDEWTYYFVQPKPNVVLCGTDRDFVKETLRRMSAEVTKRALPDELPEWKQIDRSACFWAIRRYSKPLPGEPLHSSHGFELVASGFTVTYDPAKGAKTSDSLTLRYLSERKELIEPISRLWNFSPTALTVTVEHVAPGIIEVSPEFEPDDSAEFLFRLLANLGHEINV